MQSLTVTSSVHQSSGELVNDNDLAILDNIVTVSMKEDVGTQCVVQVRSLLPMLGAVQIIYTQYALDLFHAGLGEGDDTGFFVHRIVTVGLFVFYAPRAAGP